MISAVTFIPGLNPMRLPSTMIELRPRLNTAGKIASGLGAQVENKIGDNDYDDLFIVTTTDSQSTAVRLKYGEPSVSPTR